MTSRKVSDGRTSFAAVFIKRLFTSSGLSVGSRWIIMAAAADTIGVAMLVPLSIR